jgi:hypothetical protein
MDRSASRGRGRVEPEGGRVNSDLSKREQLLSSSCSWKGLTGQLESGSRNLVSGSFSTCRWPRGMRDSQEA